MDKLQNKSWVPLIYLTFENQNIKSGITWDSIKWALTAGYAANWHPLTWLSHMLDWQLFGTDAGGHHLTNLFLHIANSLLLFTVLKRMTSALWPSAFVAALFALHPLHVESVAWITERKDVLSTFFWMLTVAAYLRYVERPSLGRYLLTLSLFALGLMAKPMLVTLPFVLLLLDHWPLGRFQLAQAVEDSDGQRLKLVSVSSRWKMSYRLVLEKVPFFALSAISSVVTFIVQRSAGAVTPVEKLPSHIRVINALTSYLVYIQKMIWPSRLAMFYPYPDKTRLMWQAIAFAPFFVFFSVAAIFLMHRRKYLFTGWLWYLGTLVPVIGLIQVGSQACADRYTYVPLIGLFIIIAWGVPDLLTKWRWAKVVLPASALVILLALSIRAHRQQQYWRDTITLCEHALDVTDPNRNFVAHFCMSGDLLRLGKIDKAIRHNIKSLEAKPGYHKPIGSLGVAFSRKGRTDLAIRWYREAIRCKPDWAFVINNLAWIQATHNQAKFRNPGEAMENALRACELTKYKNPSVLDTLAAAYAAAGRFSDAVATAEKAVELTPSSNKELAGRIQNRLRLYKAGQAYIQP
ncbi:MAG: glycosyltransferase family 39 protein [Planctomycetota bacterium]|jgi:Tfp pilus assembly protein PilF